MTSHPFRLANALAAVCMLLSGSAVQAAFIPSFAGPYLIYAERYGTCDGLPMEEAITLRVSHISHFKPFRPFQRQIFHITAVSNTTAFDDSLWGEVRAASRSNNQWKDNALVFKFPRSVCSMTREHFPSFFYSLFGRSASARGRCFVPAGTYSYEGPLNLSFPHFPVVPYGHYRGLVSLGSADVRHGCGAIEGHVIPRPH